jgi:hypothetical protein
VIGGGTIAGVKLLGSHADPANHIGVPEPELDAGAPHAGSDLENPHELAMPEADAAPPPDATAIAIARDAGRIVALARDSGVARDAALVLDAAVVVEVAPLPDAALADGLIAVTNDTWCEVLIDDRRRGRASTGPFTASPGPHRVKCEQEGMNHWELVVDVKPNETVVAKGTMLTPVTVHFAIAATLGGKQYAAGETIQVPRQRVAIEANGQKKYWTPSAPCTVRDKPELDCYEVVH